MSRRTLRTAVAALALASPLVLGACAGGEEDEGGIVDGGVGGEVEGEVGGELGGEGKGGDD